MSPGENDGAIDAWEMQIGAYRSHRVKHEPEPHNQRVDADMARSWHGGAARWHRGTDLARWPGEMRVEVMGLEPTTSTLRT
jgi:hypothetical protein